MATDPVAIVTATPAAQNIFTCFESAADAEITPTPLTVTAAEVALGIEAAICSWQSVSGVYVTELLTANAAMIPEDMSPPLINVSHALCDSRQDHTVGHDRAGIPLNVAGPRVIECFGCRTLNSIDLRNPGNLRQRY